MPTLDWMGKEKVVSHHRDVPYRTLVRVPEKGVLDSRGSDCGNIIVHGDNLAALKSLLPEYEGKVDCIYIDPPYNTGEEKWVYNDNVKDPRLLKWLGQVVGKEGEDFTRHDKWLCMMYPRLQLLKRLLSENGAIFISIGDEECENLKCICDEIYGDSCFVANVSWQRTLTKRNDSQGVPTEAEHVLIYSKRSNWKPRKLDRTVGMDASYSSPDGDPREWTSVTCSAPGAATHPGMVYAIQHPITHELMYPPVGRCWSLGQDGMLEEMSMWSRYELRVLGDEERRSAICGGADVDPQLPAIMLVSETEEDAERALEIYARGRDRIEPWPHFFFTSDGYGGMRRKSYLDDNTGRVITNFWPANEVRTTDVGKKLLAEMFDGRIPFDTVKPPDLVERCIRLCCENDALVLDSFAGSGTTAHAVLNLNALDGGSRRFILIEVEDYADDTTAERVRIAIRGYRANRKHTTNLYEQKLTATNLKNAGTFYKEALTVKEAVPDGRYDKVEGPKMDGSSIVVNGITNKGHDVPGIDSGFSFFELGPVLFDNDGMINPEVSVEDVRRYVWFTETKAAYRDRTAEHPYLLGEVDDTVYYFAYEPAAETVLAAELLRGLPIRRATTVIFADRCLLADETLEALGIWFRQIPRQIARM